MASRSDRLSKESCARRPASLFRFCISLTSFANWPEPPATRRIRGEKDRRWNIWDASELESDKSFNRCKTVFSPFILTLRKDADTPRSAKTSFRPISSNPMIRFLIAVPAAEPLVPD